VAGLGHEDDPVLLDQHKQARTGPDAELLARFLTTWFLLLKVTVEAMGAP